MTHTERRQWVLDNDALARRVAWQWRRDGLELDDLEQEARLGLLSAADAWEEGRGSLSSYAYLLSRARVRGFVQEFGAPVRDKRYDSSGGYLESVVLYDSLTEEVAACDDARERAEELISRCHSARDRDVLTLHYIYGMGYTEIAAVWGCKHPGTPRWHSEKAVERLRDMVG